MTASRGSQSDGLMISRRTIRRAGLVLGGLIAVAILAVLALVIIRSVTGDGLPSSVDPHTYQAVFLSNGQVYFGKLDSADSDHYYLRHVYLLQSGVTAKGQSTPQTLIKLTKEIHQPEDLMIIERRQVLFIENLNPSGKAARLISASGG